MLHRVFSSPEKSILFHKVERLNFWKESRRINLGSFHAVKWFRLLYLNTLYNTRLFIVNNIVGIRSGRALGTFGVDCVGKLLFASKLQVLWGSMRCQSMPSIANENQFSMRKGWNLKLKWVLEVKIYGLVFRIVSKYLYI